MNLPLNARRSRSDVVATSPRGERRGFQIGPRIRIGGSVGKVGQNIKKAVTKGAVDAGHAVGKVADNKWVQGATMAALMASGVGAPAAAAIMAAERGGGKLLKKGGNIGDGVRGGVEGAAMGYGAAKLGTAVKAGVGAIRGAGGGGAADAASAGSSVWDKAKGVFSGGGSDGQGNFGLAGDLAGKAGGAMGGGGAMDKALLVAMIADAAAKSKRQKELQDKGLAFATDAYTAKQPLRHQALEQLQNPQAPNLSGIFNNSANPYAAQHTQPVPVAPKVPILPTGGTY